MPQKKHKKNALKRHRNANYASFKTAQDAPSKDIIRERINSFADVFDDQRFKSEAFKTSGDFDSRYFKFEYQSVNARIRFSDHAGNPNNVLRFGRDNVKTMFSFYFVPEVKDERVPFGNKKLDDECFIQYEVDAYHLFNTEDSKMLADAIALLIKDGKFKFPFDKKNRGNRPVVDIDGTKDFCELYLNDMLGESLSGYVKGLYGTLSRFIAESAL